MKRLVSAVVGVVGAAAFALAAFGCRPANAAIVERVIAVVGERPILYTELLRRARPFRVRIIASSPSAAQQAAAESEMFRELLNRMIDDRLEESAADKAHLQVSSEEIDNALRNISASAKISLQDLLAEAKHQGLSEQDYRDEIRRQVLEGKLVQLRVRGRVRVTEQDSRAMYTRWLKESGSDQADVRILALRLLTGSNQQQTAARETLAQQLSLQAKSGSDFCTLVKQYSDDVSTKDTCGSRGPQSMNLLVPQILDVVKTMKPGDTSGPIMVGSEAVLVVQLHSLKVPAYEDVRPEMEQRAFGDVMERQRKLWLSELRRGVYVDVRL